MRLSRFENSVFSSNTYVVDDGKAAVIVDIGDFKPVQEYLDAECLRPKALLITHTHYDHIYGIRDFMAAFPDVPIYTSEFGKEAFNKPNWNFSRYHEDEISIDSDSIKVLNDGDPLDLFDNIDLQTIATPGHDKSCLTYRLGNMLFTGDSYIPGIKVIASFPHSSKPDALHWQAYLAEMSQTHTIFPGHGPESRRQ